MKDLASRRRATGLIASLLLGCAGTLLAQNPVSVKPASDSPEAAKPADRIRAFCIDFNWGAGGPNGFPAPGTFAQADPAAHYRWYKDLGINVIQTFCVSCNGYAWYQGSEVAPVQPGLKHDFLKRITELAHNDAVKVMGYFCVGANTYWGQKHPEQSYGIPSGIHIPLTRDYLDYLEGCIRDALTKTGIDGFMIDWAFSPPLLMEEKNVRWLPCEQKMYAELLDRPFPGKDQVDAKETLEFQRRALDRCWRRIRQAAKSAKPDCIIWLSCFDLGHPQVVGTEMLREADWVMNETPTPEKLDATRRSVGPHARLIQCVSGGSTEYDASKVLDNPKYKDVGLYGFAPWPDPKTTLPPDPPEDATQNNIQANIQKLRRVYLPPDASAVTPVALTDKTLVAWVRLDNLDQTGSGVVSIQDGDEFDAIVLGERVQRRWMAGSHVFSRTQSAEDQRPLPPETASTNQWLQIAVVYRGKQIEIWHGAQRYASYEAPNQQAYSPQSDLYLGLRCIFAQQRHGLLEGAIDEARIYNTALDGETIAKLNPGTLSEPKPLGCWAFEAGATADLMGHYPDVQLIGTAKVVDGALVLDGKGFALISQRLIPSYRPPTVQAGFYTPPQRVGQMWDDWLYWHDGSYYMYYIAGPFSRWDAHEIAVSQDGVHWDYQGTAVKPRPGTAWIGTGHVWRSPTAERKDRWILNYSEWVGDKQDIMFATSTDLLHWTKADERLRFVQDRRWYKEKGRWDCIDAVRGDDGWWYGYFTADPDPAKVPQPHCGFGFARSQDGLRWEALPPVSGDLNGEFGGIQKIGDRYYITISEGRVGVGNSPRGPFWMQKKNRSVLGGDTYFPRFFHTAPKGPLLNHFYTAGPIYAAPLKALDLDHDGILRLVWWPGNEKLKSARLPVTLRPPAGHIQWLDGNLDVNQTIVIEGTARLPEPVSDAEDLCGLVIDQGNATAECVSFERTQTRYGELQLDSQPMKMTVRQTANRDLDFGPRQRFRVLLNRDMMEVYVNDYLTVLGRVKNTGRLGLLTGKGPGEIEDLRIWRSANENQHPKPVLKQAVN